MILLKSQKEIQIMAENGRLLAQIMKETSKRVVPGAKAKELDELAEELILKEGAEPSFKNYTDPNLKTSVPFPAVLCVSINEEIVHGIPNDKILRSGDIVSLDLGLKKNGFHSDMAVTLGIGDMDSEAARLIRVTKKVLKLAVKKAKIGNTFGDIGNTIQRYAQSQGFDVARELCGHGVGRQLHEKPEILNYGKRKTGLKIELGMVFCLEPMLVMGDWRIKKGKDGFSWTTKDDSLSAHFEHTIAITEKGPKILTKTE